ncbi:L-arabinose transport system permease protein AraQ [Cellulomonas sp. T2.31MG-18]|uniref:carbohydrate ABC transporter permease n=1 Tax=Cellulomonas sp. T2.31MG-18 TaxID=3157619 RepID=UPI0035ED4276
MTDVSVDAPTLSLPEPGPVAERRHGPSGTALRVLLYVSLAVVAFAVLLPVIWMLLSSVKPEHDILAHPAQLWPTHVTFTNYSEVFKQIPFLRQFGNTVLFAGAVTLFSLFFDSMTGYALARLEFPGKRLLFLAVLLFLMLPAQVTLVPVYQLLSHLHLVNTFPGLIIPRATNAFGIFFMRQFFLGIPNDMSEAARIDGAGEFRIYSRIVLPLAMPALLTLGLFHLMFNWNDLLWPLVLTTDTAMQTLPAGLAMFMGQHVVEYGLLMAGATMAMVPMLLAFVVVQRRFIEGIATTGLK